MLGFDPKEAKKHSNQRNANNGLAPKNTAQAVPEKVAAMNQAPDTVPIMAKPGEYVLPVDTVHAMGGPEQLDSVVDATHTPAPEAAVVPEGHQPQFFFSNGGQVPEEDKGRLVKVPASMQRRENTTFAPDNSIAASAPAPAASAAAPAAASASASPKQTSPSNIYPQSSPSAGAPIYQGAGFKADSLGSSGQLAAVPGSVGQQPGRQPAPKFPAPQYPANYAGAAPAPAAVAPTADPMAGQQAAFGFNPNMQAQAARVVSGGPVTAPGAPTAATQPKKTGQIAPASPTAMYVNDTFAEAGQRLDRGDVAGMLGTATRGAIVGTGMAGVEALDKTVGAAGRAVFSGGGRFLDGLLGNEAQAAQVTPTASAPPPAAGFGPAASRAPGSPPPAIGTAAPARASTAAPPAAQPQQPAARQVAPGVYRQGNTFSDSPEGAASMAAAPAARPSAQNDAAAAALAASPSRGFAPVAQSAGVPQFRAPTPAHSGNDWTARENLRRQKMDATSLMNSKNPQMARATAAAYAAGLQEDQRAAGMGTANLQQQTQGNNMRLQQEQMQQDAANVRFNGQQAVADRRLQVDERRQALEGQTQGFQIRQAGRIEQAQQAYLSAKTPAEKAAALKQLNALTGKSEDVDLRKRYMESGGGQEWDENARVMRNLPKHIIDLQTGKPVGGGGDAKQSATQFVPGQTYRNAEGRKAVYQEDGTWLEY